MTAKIKRRLSQGQLNQLATCPPLFQRNYLEQMNLPTTLEQLQRSQWGSRFHLLMQHRELGLDIEPFLAADPEMERSLKALETAAPDLFLTNNQSWREAEHRRSLYLDGYLFTVIYDLLIITEKKARIIDWKTYTIPEDSSKLADNWQTRLYLYVLAETSDYQPEDISLTYWFVKLPQKPESVTFDYNLRQHQQTQQDLRQLLANLEEWLLAYQQQGRDFPHRHNCESDCPYYSSLVGWSLKQQPPNWNQIVSEIPEESL